MFVGYCDGCCDEDLGIVVSTHRYMEHHQSKHPGLWHIVAATIACHSAYRNIGHTFYPKTFETDDVVAVCATRNPEDEEVLEFDIFVRNQYGIMDGKVCHGMPFYGDPTTNEWEGLVGAVLEVMHGVKKGVAQ